MINFTSITVPYFSHLSERTDQWKTRSADIQFATLKNLLKSAASAAYIKSRGIDLNVNSELIYRDYIQKVPLVEYEDIRTLIMRMIEGERDILWPGKCMRYAQSSGTSGAPSKYIPITPRSLHKCHYAGAQDAVAHYIKHNPKSRIFSGKAFVLGGSFANTLPLKNPALHVGDLSASLIEKINPVANMFRVPNKHIALLSDWEEKLPALVKASMNADITNISGVPSWFLTVIKEVIKARGVNKISDVWPNLEVFFHGGISFEPYREIYASLTDSKKMHFVETYNASEGFFAVQNDPDDRAMLLTIDNDIFYEFIDFMNPESEPVTIADVEVGKVYELVISSSNGLWRYRLGDTLRIASTNPVKITIAGRTKTFINAFGEELMEDNAERAIAAACRQTQSHISNYTVAPVFATNSQRGRHQWLIEWQKAPTDARAFADILDAELRKLNSDYDAKRAHTIFLDPLEIISLPVGTFSHWLQSSGNGKLGGQRKIPRLSNDRRIADKILETIR